MINDQKYFTPAIEDLRVGYEFERIHSFQKKTWTKDAISEFYFFPKGDGTVGILDMVFSIKEGTIRVPYLTKEQIESEGWDFYESTMIEEDRPGFDLHISEDEWYNLKQEDDHTILISHCKYRNEVTWVSNVLFNGSCPDINTLRYIQKLLGIK